ncbi:MAG TPA: YdeI/OmpD-associated family protein [Labilithrix sp.]|jgi:uncharacterized protein YdeI (YjbR/CyaY-like superfamily)
MSASPSFCDLSETLATASSGWVGPVLVPTELARALDARPDARRAFGEASDRDRRGFCQYVVEAHLSDSRERRAALVCMMLE